MHPAPSIVLFTTASGLGFGLIAWLGLALTPLDATRALALAALAFALASGGLLVSLAHLGQPRRFFKAFSQWRSAWLSREAVLAVATLAAFAALILARLTTGRALPWLGLAVTALALATVLATAMIYAQMKTVPRWRTPLVPVNFLASAIAGGALLAGETLAAAWGLAALGLAQIATWVQGDRRRTAPRSTLATATGLGPLGRLRLLEPPHTGPNYLLREMVFVIGRKHALKLRLIGFALAVLLPLGLVLALADGPLATGLAALCHAAGVLILRWLFFAEAAHVVGLYYGKG